MIKILLVFFFFTLYCFHRAVHKITKSTLYYQNQNFLFLFDPPAGSGTAESCYCHYHLPNALWWNYCSKRHLSSTSLHPPSFFLSTLWEERQHVTEAITWRKRKKKRSCSQIPDERFVLAILINHELAPSKSLSCGMNYYSQLLFPTFSVRCAPKALSDELSNTTNYVKCVNLNTFQTGCCKTITSKWKKYTTMQAHEF